MIIQSKFFARLSHKLVLVALATSVTWVIPSAVAGSLPWEIWALINGSSVQDLIDSGATNNAPDAVYSITNSLDTFNVGKTDDHLNTYGSRIRGFLQVPETGVYQLFLSSADASQLSLSTDSDPTHLTLVAEETGSGAALFSGARIAERTSPPLNLVKGQSYYLEVLHKASTGSDFVRVGWQKPDGTQQIIPALYFLPWSPDASSPVFTESPAAANVIQGNPLVLTSTVQAQQPATFQWYKDNLPLAGENVQTLFLADAALTNGGVYRLDVTDANSNLTSSSAAVVAVTPDTTPPTVIAAELNSKFNLLTVVFSEKVAAAPATNAGNYSLNNGAGLSGGTLAADGVTVNFNVSGLTPGQSGFVLSLSGVADRFSNFIAPAEWRVNLVWTETFSGGPGYFTAANLNHANGNDIDYSFSINAGGSVGEIGGTFVKTLTTAAGYIADPTLGATISLSNNVVIRGQLYVRNLNANGNYFIGFTSVTNSFSSVFGLQLAEPGGGFEPNFRGRSLAGAVQSARFPVAPEVTVPFSLNWNAAAGILAANVGSQTIYTTNLAAATLAFNTFTIAAYGANSIDATRKAVIYVDNLTYSVGAIRPVPTATGPSVGAIVQSPVSGQIFTNGSVIPLSAQALTAAQPIARVEFYAQPISGGSQVKVGEVTNASPTNVVFGTSWSGVADGGYTLTARAITTDPLIATSAPVNVYVVSAAPLVPVTEPFAGGLGRFQTQLNSQLPGNSFGFNNTGNANGAAAGEAGGLFVRTPIPSYLADTNTGWLYPQLADLDLSGQIYLQNNNWNGGAFVGYLNHTNLAARLGISINEPGASSGSSFRGSVVIGSSSSATINLDPGTPITFSLHWSSASNLLTGTLAGQPVSLAYVPLTESFNTLAIGTLGNSTTDNTAQLNLFADDLSYTTVVAAPRLNISVLNGQVTLSWTAAGFKLQRRNSLAAGGGWTDDTTTVNSNNGVLSVTEPASSDTRFWRLAPQ